MGNEFHWSIHFWTGNVCKWEFSLFIIYDGSFSVYLNIPKEWNEWKLGMNWDLEMGYLFWNQFVFYLKLGIVVTEIWMKNRVKSIKTNILKLSLINRQWAISAHCEFNFYTFLLKITLEFIHKICTRIQSTETCWDLCERFRKAQKRFTKVFQFLCESFCCD